jgi:small-conductance mechanosensitive channel
MDLTWSQFLEIISTPVFYLGNTPVTPASIVQFLILITFVLFGTQLLRRILRDRVLNRFPLGVGLKDAIARLVSYVFLVLGVIIILQTLGFDLTTLTVLAGALGVGIGFGLQNIVNNFISGLIILTERPIQVGDRVEVGGTEGDVVRIGGSSTTIRTNDNIHIIIPNSEFVSDRVINLSYGDPKVRMRIPFGVGYDSDPHQVEKLALEVAKAQEAVLSDPGPSVRFIEFGDNSLNFELRVWTIELAHRPGLFRSELYFALWEKFKAHDIEIPFPQRDLNFTGPVQVEMRPNNHN